MKKIAIVGGGISGLTVAERLSEQFEITLFEQNDYLGGHTQTHQLEIEGCSRAIDTGFIVYNDRTYPNFMALLARLGCEGQPTEMSFSLKRPNLEYNGHSFKTLFAQKSNLFRPRFWKMLRDIVRFNRIARLV
ncbi:MAG TPA: FAD-dependent oxidoreductase, partial [Gammaproteobacteria bacterium]|nr:FAD-dependent oxidoreductase [Gammaproteobacteria bacterium]